jgi:hypothetical protein
MSWLFVIHFVTLADTALLPHLAVVRGPGAECGRPVLVAADGASRLLIGAPADFCIRDALAARLEESADTHVVLQVEGLGSDPAERLFIYRLDGDQLVPRYLASGPAHLRLVGVERLAGVEQDSLLVHAVTVSGRPVSLSCSFVGFPLLCVRSHVD